MQQQLLQNKTTGFESIEVKTLEEQNLPIYSFLNRNLPKRKRVQQEQEVSEQIEILSSRVVNQEFVIYQIKITRGQTFWIFQTRYSLLAQLDEKVSKETRKIIPGFPKKRFFGNLDETFLQKRKEQLNLYLEGLFKQGKSESALKEFIKQSKIAAIQINDPKEVKHFKLDA